jgi:hypothetical protein
VTPYRTASPPPAPKTWRVTRWAKYVVRYRRWRALKHVTWGHFGILLVALAIQVGASFCPDTSVRAALILTSLVIGWHAYPSPHQ